MADPPRALELRAWWPWSHKLRARTRGQSALPSVLAWIRTIALEDDVIHWSCDDPLRRYALAPLAGSWLLRQEGHFHFRFPSLPTARPQPITDPDAATRARFKVRVGAPSAEVEPGWRPVLKLRDLLVIERDAPHGRERPLRLGVDAEEGSWMLAQARRSAERFLAGESDGPGVSAIEHPRLAQRSSVAVALWTRGRMRGSVITSPGPALQKVAQASVAACQDARFPRLSAADLAETVFQVGLLHAPRVPLSREEIGASHAYPDKALFASEASHSGAYMPEVFNVFPRRIARLKALAESLARDKVGLPGLGPNTRIEVNEVTEVADSADRSRAVALDGPVARWDETAVRSHVQAAGRAACDWIGAILGADGSLPLFVRPSTGQGEGVDILRSGMTAQALAAFGIAFGLESAAENARRVLAWLDRSRATWVPKRGLALPATIYLGKAAAYLGDDTTLDAATRTVLDRLEGPDPGPLVLAEAASFLALVSARDPRAGDRCESLRRELLERFTRARASDDPVNLAEWAELGAAFPVGSRASRDVMGWLRGQQLPSGAFPETTSTDFVYSRGTGKVFEVLALDPTESPGAIDRAMKWLLSMQYREDSVFFVPCEHRRRVVGGLRHDYYGPDAWIDAAGHFLLGLARLGSR
jgi:AMMECR1 domain-containing protein